jgi:hypothetical protein
VVGFTTGSRAEVPGKKKRKPVTRNDDDDNNNSKTVFAIITLFMYPHIYCLTL